MLDEEEENEATMRMCLRMSRCAAVWSIVSEHGISDM